MSFGLLSNHHSRLATAIFAATVGCLVADGSNVRAQEESAIVRIDSPSEFDDEGTVTLDFDRNPKGEGIYAGSDISNVYIPYGCKLSCPDDSLIPTVQAYRVHSKQSAANSEKDDRKGLSYTGVTVVQFCEPGDENSPATITRFCVRLSYVSPGGTAVKAFDEEGELIGEIQTTVVGYEFLAFRSDTPVASIQIVPNNEVDPDYAYDTVRFDRPVTR